MKAEVYWFFRNVGEKLKYKTKLKLKEYYIDKKKQQYFKGINYCVELVFRRLLCHELIHAFFYKNVKILSRLNYSYQNT